MPDNASTEDDSDENQLEEAMKEAEIRCQVTLLACTEADETGW